MLLKSLTMKGILSFGPEGQTLDLLPLNVLIGPNGSGKSNLIDVVALLRAAPQEIAGPVREGGGVLDWLHKSQTADGRRAEVATVQAVVVRPYDWFSGGHPKPLRYGFSFREQGGRFTLNSEELADEGPNDPHTYFDSGSSHLFEDDITYRPKNGENEELKLRVASSRVEGGLEQINLDETVLSQLKGPPYSETTYVARSLSSIRIYREWAFGRFTSPRLPQRTDARNDALAPDFSNLGLILNKLGQTPQAKRRLVRALSDLYEDARDVGVAVEGGTVQVFVEEASNSIPATRLSDGTLRYLCLLAILCDPTPPPLVCLEEPELGLHPDILPKIADLLVEASERTQLIVTTHSDILIDALSEHPEYVVVCEKHDGETKLRRLNRDDLAVWLEKDYGLGHLWLSGEIGGKRW